MSEPNLPSDPRSGQGPDSGRDDRELEEFLAGRSAVSRLYRTDAAATRAPSELDASVLAAAAVAAPRSVPQQSRIVRRWRLPLSLAASLVVGIGIVRQVQQDELAKRVVSGEQVAVEASISKPESAPVFEPEKKLLRDAMPHAGPQDRAEPVAPPVPAKPAVPAAKSAAAAPPLTDPLSAPPPLASAMRRPEPAVVPAPSIATEDAFNRQKNRQLQAAAKSSSSALASASLGKPAEAETADAAQRSRAAASRPGAAAWKPGVYRGLRLGSATADDLQRQMGSPDVADSADAPATLPDGREQHRLFEFNIGKEPRGSLRIHVDANSQALASVSLSLNPPLSLASVEAQEGLKPPVSIRAGDAPLCVAGVDSLGADAPYPHYRVYPAQGVYLLLTAPDRVAEIDYFELCE